MLASNDRALWPEPLDILTAKGLSDIGISGGGKVDGQGAIWWSVHLERRRKKKERRKRGKKEKKRKKIGVGVG